MLNSSIDATDLKILEHMQENCRLTNVELAEKINLSPSPCSRRMRNLETTGVIKGYMALIDQNAVDLPVNVFIQVSLEHQGVTDLSVFEDAILSRPEVMECYLMTGDADYLLRVVAKDLEAYKQFLLDYLTQIPGIANIKSSFSLKQVVYKTALPL